MTGLNLRLASAGDVAAIRDLLADDRLGKAREDTSEQGLAKYQAAFEKIEQNPDNELWVAEMDNEIVGTWQVTYIAYLSRGGNIRCLVEAVRTASKRRGQGIGRQMMRYAVDQARNRGCQFIQLTTDKSRQDAHRLYKALGFENTHEGMKLQLT
jgi:GNAT superfamily N-acetyltransferase